MLSVVAACLTLATAVWLARAAFTPRLPVMTSSSIVVTPSPNLVVSVRELHRLEGASFHMERVIELDDRQSRLFGLIDAKDAILLVAAGDVTVDWAQRSAHIRLPSPEVFSVAIDNGKTHVYSRKTDVLAARNEDLEGKAREEAESSMRKAALEGGILATSRKGTSQAVTGLARALGFTDVAIEWQ